MNKKTKISLLKFQFHEYKRELGPPNDFFWFHLGLKSLAYYNIFIGLGRPFVKNLKPISPVKIRKDMIRCIRKGE
ncbi:MAG: hypothetical protein ACI9YL_002252, partial [Luteibaculaceae bacterium]